MDPEFFGQIINGYKIEKPIGQGKFSIVFKAIRLEDNMTVALKLIKQIFDMED